MICLDASATVLKGSGSQEVPFTVEPCTYSETPTGPAPDDGGDGGSALAITAGRWLPLSGAWDHSSWYCRRYSDGLGSLPLAVLLLGAACRYRRGHCGTDPSDRTAALLHEAETQLTEANAQVCVQARGDGGAGQQGNLALEGGHQWRSSERSGGWRVAGCPHWATGCVGADLLLASSPCGPGTTCSFHRHAAGQSYLPVSANGRRPSGKGVTTPGRRHRTLLFFLNSSNTIFPSRRASCCSQLRAEQSSRHRCPPYWESHLRRPQHRHRGEISSLPSRRCQVARTSASASCKRTIAPRRK